LIPVGSVVALKVLDQHFVDTLSVGWVAATITHRTTSTVQILPHDHGNFPHTGIGFRRARRDHAIMEDLVVESVWPGRWLVFIYRHR
jgi:hypothetical protein